VFVFCYYIYKLGLFGLGYAGFSCEYLKYFLHFSINEKYIFIINAFAASQICWKISELL